MELLTQWILPLLYILIAVINVKYFYDLCGDVIKGREEKLEDNGREKYLRLPLSILMGIIWPIIFLVTVCTYTKIKPSS